MNVAARKSTPYITNEHGSACGQRRTIAKPKTIVTLFVTPVPHWIVPHNAAPCVLAQQSGGAVQSNREASLLSFEAQVGNSSISTFSMHIGNGWDPWFASHCFSPHNTR